MTSDQARELAQQLVARADVLLFETTESGGGVSSRRYMVDGLEIAIALFLIVIMVSSATGTAIASFSNRSAEPPGFGFALLRIAVVWVFAFTPGWIFVRFVTLRMPPIWATYVADLYRLGWDHPENLPPPPVSSPFFESWRAAGGEGRMRRRDIYRQKFDAFYGASAAATGRDRLHRVRVETLSPEFLLTALLSACWTALLWDVHNLDLSSNVSKLWICLAFGFLGAYTFGLTMLIRRFAQNDLRPSAYARFVLRVIVVLFLALWIHLLLNELGAGTAIQAVVMFVVGIFPLPSVQAVQRQVALYLRQTVPSLRGVYPLSDLEGMSPWFESRLLEEGVQDMQSLVAANLVDVQLHTQISTARLIDWIDQAILLLHIDRSEQDLALKLRKLGVRTATDLLATFPAEEMESTSERTGSTRASLDAITGLNGDATTVRSLIHAVARDPNLVYVSNWKSGGPAYLSDGDGEHGD